MTPSSGLTNLLQATSLKELRKSVFLLDSQRITKDMNGIWRNRQMKRHTEQSPEESGAQEHLSPWSLGCTTFPAFLPCKPETLQTPFFRGFYGVVITLTWLITSLANWWLNSISSLSSPEVRSGTECSNPLITWSASLATSPHPSVT